MHEVLSALARHADERPDVVALDAPDARLTYAALARAVEAAADHVQDLGQTVGILAPNTSAWVVADLALALAGKTLVPLPPFFSPAQLHHIAQDADIDHVLCTAQTTPLAEGLGRPVSLLEDLPSAPGTPRLSRLDVARGATRVIYTSGTTGTPKGVRIGARQITASARGLLAAGGATAADRYLSVLPFALLLEQIAAICVPLLAGAPVTLAPDDAARAQAGDPQGLIEAFATARPTASVLVPGLLGAWVQGLRAAGERAPDGLRFVAVGGAHVPAPLADAAWNAGIPVHEGYGLSECCSVVSVNRPGDRVPGTAGRPLDGLNVRIEDGEIVVQGPTVMDGYLGRDDVPDATWRTGDLGEITPDGALRVLGRKDRLIVTPEGRNIHPEWIETIALGAPGVRGAHLAWRDGTGLVLTITPAPGTDADVARNLHDILAEAPAYARPHHIAIADSPGA